MGFLFAAGPGLEPGSREPESRVLPKLHHPAIYGSFRKFINFSKLNASVFFLNQIGVVGISG